MFIDEVKLEVNAGSGGDGIVAYRRELKVEKGGPFGGSGGKGADVIFVGDEGINTLLDLKYKKIIKAQNGEKGKNKGMQGASAENYYVRVPLGTIVYDDDTGKVICDITKHNEEFIICKGGRGGRGNMAFASGTVKCPDFCENGEPGERRFIRCELKVLADCGLVGYPSVGKSTIISVMSNCKPKIAAYHFTTLAPHLGMVYVSENKSFVMADLPGIIEGASQGLGLGLMFLRHIERCRVIIHVIDMAATDGRDPYQDYITINNELKEYQPELLLRPQIIVANKMDSINAKKNLEKFKKHVDKEIIEISAIKKENLDILKYKISDLLDQTNKINLIKTDELEYKDYKFEKPNDFFNINIDENNVFNITGKGIEKLFKMTNFNSDSAINRFARQLRSYGVDDKLRELGIKQGDLVKIFDYEFEYVD